MTKAISGLVALICVLGSLAASPPRGRIVDVGLSFEVLNVNRSSVPCPTDGGRYELRGHLVAPARSLRAPEAAVTVYVPGAMATAAGIYRNPAANGAYDVPRGLAELGHASVVIDRLGFGRSGTPNGWAICSGGEADVLHQVVQHLRAGTYGAEGNDLPAFDRIALAGHSGGGLWAAAEAYSFGDVDALLMLASALDQGLLPLDSSAALATDAVPTCLLGGERKRGDGPGGYSFLFPISDDFFHDIDPVVKHQFLERAEREPCGNLDSLATLLAMNRLLIPTIDVPVLFLAAEHDNAFPPEAMERQRRMYTGSPDTSLVVVEEAGHAYMLERGMSDGRPAAERFRLAVSDWLTIRGF